MCEVSKESVPDDPTGRVGGRLVREEFLGGVGEGSMILCYFGLDEFAIRRSDVA